MIGHEKALVSNGCEMTFILFYLIIILSSSNHLTVPILFPWNSELVYSITDQLMIHVLKCNVM